MKARPSLIVTIIGLAVATGAVAADFGAKKTPAPGAAKGPARAEPAVKPLGEGAVVVSDAPGKEANAKINGAVRESAQWIWSPAHALNEAPAGACYFRKTFPVSGAVESAVLFITADDAFEVFINGRSAGAGANWKLFEKIDIASFIAPGENTIAVKVMNDTKSSAGLVARLLLKEKGSTQIAMVSDATWMTSLRELPHWNKKTASSDQWLAAQEYGALGMTLPWGNETRTADAKGRFQVTKGFRVEWVVAPESTGSLIAMTFNEFGQIIASRENGPLVLISDSDDNGIVDAVSVYCDQLKNCEGLLALNGSIYATADGPDGAAVYRVDDTDRDGVADSVKSILKFKGKPGEHGAHALRLGPDGRLYLMVGNHVEVDAPLMKKSPYQHPYEGDLNQPRFEDPGGHAIGVKAPGGTVVRFDPTGDEVEIVTGGLRNAYDMAFNRAGDLFTVDSDMEWNMGLPWYLPTRVFHCAPGAELGWRSGWANWPGNWLDVLPAAAETGPGSPTGMEVYDHHRYPARYHDAMFTCDWGRGRINTVRFKQVGASYQAKSNVFLKGEPLNVTDIAVGPDGWLYFCTGGRDTEGGLYCVTWAGETPPDVAALGTGIDRAIRQPQFEAAWARQQIAAVRRDMGSRWDEDLVAVVTSDDRPAAHRVRGLDLMELFGPMPDDALLVSLTKDAPTAVRVKATRLLGNHLGSTGAGRLAELLGDPEPMIRRVACEELMRGQCEMPIEQLVDLLGDSDRFVAFAARRCLEQTPVDEWESLVMNDNRTSVFLHGAVAILAANPERKSGQAIVNRCLRMMNGEVSDSGNEQGFISDADFTDLLRVVELSLHRCNLHEDAVPTLGQAIMAEYPSRDDLINRELVRLMVYLQASGAASTLVEQLHSPIPDLEKLHIAAHAPFLKTGWTMQERLALLQFYEQARISEGGEALRGYIDNMSKDFFGTMTGDERSVVLKSGSRWPSSALAVLAGLPADPGEATVSIIVRLDRDLDGLKKDDVERLRMGIVAVLGRSRRPEAMAYLREIYEHDPARRPAAAIGLAQQPDGENWPLLIRTLPIAEGSYARLLMMKLGSVDRNPSDAEVYRQTIVCALRSPKELGAPAAALMTHWTGENPATGAKDPAGKIAAWQKWFSETYPNMLPATLPTESTTDKWTFEELQSYLASVEGKAGHAGRGALVFEQAQCAKCHRFGGVGARVGPDLTTVSRRFQTREVLQSILFPSHVISDQYASETLSLADGRIVTGIVGAAGSGKLNVIQADGQTVSISEDEIEERQPSGKSVMPEGLLNSLSLNDIADLFAYMNETPRTDVTSRRSNDETK